MPDPLTVGRAYPAQPRVPTPCPAPPASSANSGSSTGQPSAGPGLADFQIRLISAMLAQTEAINRLASSNEALVKAMAESDGQEEREPTTYLNGRPRA